MRIIGGRWRGLRLAEVGEGDAAAHLRPTADRVREAIYNLIGQGAHGDPISGARVLDLFAGTGALGLEALSRGAAHATFVEDGAAARAIIRRNIDLTRSQGATDVWRRDATDLGTNRGAPFGLVFLDPPYGKGLGEAAIASALAGGWLAPEALVVWEEGAPPRPPPGLSLLDQRRYGNAWVTLLRASTQALPRPEGD
jgi:16S rRNA (guanine966-N2)-methyltransferase